MMHRPGVSTDVLQTHLDIQLISGLHSYTSWVQIHSLRLTHG